ncbi:MAG: acyltransferase family protein, partial [Clostridia bacterium]|nr:acyltransferase family protein [Clostridia bacterium]
MLTKKQTFNSTISLIRCIAMVFIVTCHFFQFYGNELAWWFNVGVQMFFCVSGFLYGNKEIDDSIGFVLKNFKKILIPYFTFLFPCIILYFVFAKEYISVFSALKAVACSGVIKGIGHLWFISYILFCYIITPFLYNFVDEIKELKCIYVLIVFVIVLLVGQVAFFAYDSYFLFSRISCYIIGYFLAFILKQYGSIIFKRIACVFAIGAIICNLFRIFVKYFLK